MILSFFLASFLLCVVLPPCLCVNDYDKVFRWRWARSEIRGVVLDGSGLVVLDFNDNGQVFLYLYNLTTKRLVDGAGVPYDCGDPKGLAWYSSSIHAPGKVWYIDGDTDEIVLLYPSHMKRERMPAPGPGCTDLSYDFLEHYLWVTDNITDMVYKVTLRAGVVGGFRSPYPDPVGVACTSDGYLWIAHANGALTLVGRENGIVYQELLIQNYSISGLAQEGPFLWVLSTSLGEVRRYISHKAFFRADPEEGEESLRVQFFDQTHHYIDFDLVDTSWSWDFGDGSTGEGKRPVHTYGQNGEYTVSMVITSLNGTYREKKHGFIVVGDSGPNANYRVTPGYPTNGEPPLIVSFDDLSTSYDGMVEWSWRFGDGSISHDRNPTHTYTQRGWFIVSLTVFEADGDMDTHQGVVISIRTSTYTTIVALSLSLLFSIFKKNVYEGGG